MVECHAQVYRYSVPARVLHTVVQQSGWQRDPIHFHEALLALSALQEARELVEGHSKQSSSLVTMETHDCDQILCWPGNAKKHSSAWSWQLASAKNGREFS